MTVDEQALHLADRLMGTAESGGAYLDEAEAELAAKALRWFALIATRVQRECLSDDVTSSEWQAAADVAYN